MGVRFWRPLDFGTLGVRDFGSSRFRDLGSSGFRDFGSSGVRGCGFCGLRVSTAYSRAPGEAVRYAVGVCSHATK